MLVNRLSCRLVLLASVLGLAATLKGDQPAELRQTPLAPADSLQLIELVGSHARLLAHEPQVVDPVEVAFDDAGRMWVVEMRDYPFVIDDQPHGQIVVLSDHDGDGEYESSQVFADHLDMPTGLALWKEGVVATVAGQLIYLTDKDGDGRADHTQVWLEGFSKGNEQLRANHPRLGPDGWWYIACGLRGGAVQLGPELRGEAPAAPLEIGSRDVRFHLATKTIELVTGPAQFGITFDGIGQRIFCSNRNPATQVMFEQADLVGNPLAGLAPSIVDVVPAGESSRVYPLVNAWVTSHLHAGQFTAACGVFARGLDDGRTDIFACEPTGSLVHRQRSKRVGVRLVPDADQQVPEGREWLASRDAWFRPVNVTGAPDGAIVVVDMHRAVIEHPDWVPEELKQRPDERWGDQAGRIVSVGPQAQISGLWGELRDRPLRARGDTELVQLIGSDNPWLRQTSARLLLQRATTNADATASSALASNANVDALQQLVADTSLTPDARCAALRLAVLLAVSPTPETVSDEAATPTDAERRATLASPTSKAVSDESAKNPIDANHSPIAIAPLLAADLSQAGQRELAMVALRLSRQYPHILSVHPDELMGLATRSVESGIRFEAWLCLGAQVGSDSWQATRGQLDEVVHAWAVDGDPYLLMAAASGLRNQPDQLLQSWLATLAQAPVITEAAIAQVPQIARGLMAATLRKTESSDGSGSTGAVDALKPLVEQIVQLLSEPSLAKSSSTNGAAALAALECLQSIVKQPKLRTLIESSTWEQLAKLVENDSLPLHLRVAAIALLADSPQGDTPQRLAQMVAHTTDPELTGPLIQAWCAVGGDAPNSVLLDRLASASPPLQRVLLPLIAANEKRLELLAQQLDSGQLAPGQFGVAELTKLVGRASGETKSRLQQQLSRISNSNRAQVVEQYKSCLALDPDVQRGAELFRQHCASCHRVGDIGVDVGPNISDSRVKKPLELLIAILDPNLAIDNNFFRFVVLTEDGRVVEGIIVEETADALVIRGQDDRRELIRREDIATMKATGVSLMPEGLEAQIDPQAMADLIGFVKGWRYLDGAVPLN